MPRKKKVNQQKEIVNGLESALGFPSNNFFGPGVGTNPFAPQVQNANTLFGNMRFYLITNFRDPISQAYVELPLVQTVVDVPVDDALRGGIEIQSKQLSEDQIQELLIKIDRDEDLIVLGQSAKWQRLFGGAGIIIFVDDQDPEKALDLDSIKKGDKVEFRSVDMWELFPDSQNIEGYNPTTQADEFDHYEYYGKKVHVSRVLRMNGRTAPSFLRPRLRGWGLSELEMLVRSINQYLKATDLIFSCLDEFKVDIYKIKDLVNSLMSPQGEQAVKQRIQIANQQKNYQNAIVMDSEDDWDHKQISFGGIAETLHEIRMQVAADMHFPITKLFGTSLSQGIGNTDQNDMENYNSMIESQVRNRLKHPLLMMQQIKCKSIFGYIPDDLEIKFKPLRVLTAEQEENVKNSQYNRLLQARQLGEISSEQFQDACNRAALFPIQVDVLRDQLNPDDDDAKAGDVTETDKEEKPSSAEGKKQLTGLGAKVK